MQLTIKNTTSDRGTIAREILEDLQEWFWNPGYRAEFVESAETLPMFACFDDADKAIGFITIKPTSEYAIEIYVMGVKRQQHRSGAGRALINAVNEYAMHKGARYITVKTIGSAHPSKGYEATRRFYESMGFIALEESELYWGENWPCLLLIRAVGISGTE